MSADSTGSDKVTYRLDGDVAVIVLDDGRVNVFSPETIGAIHTGLDRAEREAKAVVLAGRPGKLSGGFDLDIMKSGPEAARDLVGSGGELILRIYEFPMPVVVACTGHAIAAAAILLMAADVRIGTEGEFKIGLNEVAIGLPLPEYGVELGRDRLEKRHFLASVLHARLWDPFGAADAGFLDEVATPDDVVGVALHKARSLAKELHPEAFRITRRTVRAALADRIRTGMREDLSQLLGLPND